MAVWSETPQGVSLSNAWAYVADHYKTVYPGYSAALKTLATRPING